jgi:hypothetical protein
MNEVRESAATGQGVVVCPESRPARVGERVLPKGGNAVDAIVAAAFVQGGGPAGCGICGNMSLYYRGAGGEVEASLNPEHRFAIRHAGVVSVLEGALWRSNPHEVMLRLLAREEPTRL